jgi:hypothetical protein
LVAVTEEGGVDTTATVFVDESEMAIFDDGFESGSFNAWTSAVP